MRAQGRCEIHAFFGRVVDDQHAIHTGVGGIADKPMGAVAQVVVFHRVGVAHQHDRRVGVFGSKRAHHVQHFTHAHAVAQRGFTGFLNHGAVGHRVAEGHTEFDDVCAALHQRMHEWQGVGRVGVACHQIGNQGFAALLLQVGQGGGDAAHALTPLKPVSVMVCSPLTDWPWQLGRQKKSALDKSATVPMSLSPRPERLTNMDCCGVMVLASFMA